MPATETIPERIVVITCVVCTDESTHETSPDGAYGVRVDGETDEDLSLAASWRVVLYKCDACGVGYYLFPEARWLVSADLLMKAAMMLPTELQAELGPRAAGMYEKIVDDAKVEVARERGDIAAGVDEKLRGN